MDNIEKSFGIVQEERNMNQTYIYYRLFLGVEKAPINTAPGRFLRSDGRFLRSLWALSQV